MPSTVRTIRATTLTAQVLVVCLANGFWSPLTPSAMASASRWHLRAMAGVSGTEHRCTNPGSFWFFCMTRVANWNGTPRVLMSMVDPTALWPQNALERNFSWARGNVVIGYSPPVSTSCGTSRSGAMDSALSAELVSADTNRPRAMAARPISATSKMISNRTELKKEPCVLSSCCSEKLSVSEGTPRENGSRYW
jgi:hypothetical protein